MAKPIRPGRPGEQGGQGGQGDELSPAATAGYQRAALANNASYLQGEALHQQRMDAGAAEQRHKAELEHLQAVQQATLDVRAAVKALADETTRAQRFALRVGVGTTLVGSVVGGFAGAIAARIVGS